MMLTSISFVAYYVFVYWDDFYEGSECQFGPGRWKRFAPGKK